MNNINKQVQLVDYTVYQNNLTMLYVCSFKILKTQMNELVNKLKLMENTNSTTTSLDHQHVGGYNVARQNCHSFQLSNHTDNQAKRYIHFIQ